MKRKFFVMKLDPYFSLGVFTFERLQYATWQTDDRRYLSGS